jgi:hypothetical protein
MGEGVDDIEVALLGVGVDPSGASPRHTDRARSMADGWLADRQACRTREPEHAEQLRAILDVGGSCGHQADRPTLVVFLGGDLFDVASPARVNSSSVHPWRHGAPCALVLAVRAATGKAVPVSDALAFFAFLIARFCLMDLSDFLVGLWRGDLSDMEWLLRGPNPAGSARREVTTTGTVRA